jgi:hypothetical protein
LIAEQVHRHLGDSARIWLFGSRLEDNKRGGDVDLVIQAENLSKYDRLGLIGGGTLREDVNRWIAIVERTGPVPGFAMPWTRTTPGIAPAVLVKRTIPFQLPTRTRRDA